MEAEFPILIFENDLTFEGQIDNYEFLSWNYKYRMADTFTIFVNFNKTNVTNLARGKLIGFTDIDGETKAGIIDHFQIKLTEEGKLSQTVEIRGFGLDGLTLQRRALDAVEAGTGYDNQNDKAETNMRHYVNINMINAADADRDYSLLELEADQTRGATINYQARFQTIHQILEEHSLLSDLGWTINLDLDNSKFKFHILEGVDRSAGNGVNSEVKFSPEFDSVKFLQYVENSLQSKNVAVVAGQNEAQNRDIEIVQRDGGTFTDLDRREFFVDARDLATQAELIQRGNEKLADIGDEISFQFDNAESSPFTFKEDYDLGDIVTVTYPTIATEDSRVVEVIRNITPEGGSDEQVIVGKKDPDLIKLVKLNFKNTDPETWR